MKKIKNIRVSATVAVIESFRQPAEGFNEGGYFGRLITAAFLSVGV